MNWNYRVIRHTAQDQEYFEIHEVHYDDQGLPIACAEQPASAYGNTVEELSACMIHMQSALTQPILDAKIFEQTQNSAQSVHQALNMIGKNTNV